MTPPRLVVASIAAISLAAASCSNANSPKPTSTAPGEVTSSDKALPMPIDTKAMFPIIVPTGYLPITSPGPARMPFLDGLEVALYIDHPGKQTDSGESFGLAMTVRDIDLAAAKLTLKDAYRIAIDNLEIAAKSGLIHIGGAAGSDDKVQMVIWQDDWRAASCLLLPGVHKMAAAALGSDNVVAMIPHRDVLILFADKGTEYREATAKLVRDKEEPLGRKPITNRLLRLLPPNGKPFYETVPVAYVP